MIQIFFRILYCGLAPQRGEHRGSKVADVCPGVTDVYRNGLLHVSRGSPLAHILYYSSAVRVAGPGDDSSRCLRVQAVHADLACRAAALGVEEVDRGLKCYIQLYYYIVL